MALIDIDWKPDSGKLRGFGVTSLMVFGALGTWLYFKGHLFGIDFEPGTARGAGVVLWAAGAISCILAAAAPRALLPLYRGLCAVTFPIGYVVSHLLLGFIFYGVLTPVALFFRAIGRDSLQRSFEPARSSYWLPRCRPRDSRQYYRQF